ncbi:MAG: BON domain-containing protein [Armatimonadetes bacterium]|nr:BON domain-containing protein [Armatimonadota bacterium]
MAVIDKLKALQIKANIIADRTVGLMEVETEVQDGVAILRGEVESEEQKRVAENLARAVDGIIEVRNEIEVVPPSPERAANCEGVDTHLGYGLIEVSMGDTKYSLGGGYEMPGPGIPTTDQFPGEFTDEEIEEEVYDRLANQREVEVDDLEIESTNQIVLLKGSVRTYNDLTRLQNMVLNLSGVIGVISEVAVQEDEIGTPTNPM